MPIGDRWVVRLDRKEINRSARSRAWRAVPIRPRQQVLRQGARILLAVAVVLNIVGSSATKTVAFGLLSVAVVCFAAWIVDRQRDVRRYREGAAGRETTDPGGTG